MRVQSDRRSLTNSVVVPHHRGIIRLVRDVSFTVYDSVLRTLV